MSEQPGNPQQHPSNQPQQFPPAPHEASYSGPPPGGPPPPAPPGPGGGNRRVLIALAAVLVLLVGGGIAAAIALSGGDDDEDDARMGPVETVEAALDALEDGDCEKVREFMPSLDETQCHALEPDGFTFEDPEEVRNDGAKATVAVPVTSEQLNGTVAAMVDLERDGDRWVAVNLHLPEALGGPPERTCSSEDDPGCAPESSPPTDESPETSTSPPAGDDDAEVSAVAEAFVTAIEENDCEAAKEIYLDPESADCADLELDDQGGITFGDAKGPFSSGDRSHVMVEMLADGQKLPQVLQIDLVKDPERGWLVSGWQS